MRSKDKELLYSKEATSYNQTNASKRLYCFA